MSLCSLLLSAETPNDVRSVAYQPYNSQATSKGAYQTARMRRLIWGFAGRTYHTVGNLMSRSNVEKTGSFVPLSCDIALHC